MRKAIGAARTRNQERARRLLVGPARLSGMTAKASSFLAGFLIAAITILTTVDVLTRQAGLWSIQGVLEVTEVGLPAIVFLGMAAAELDHIHVRTPILTNNLSRQPAFYTRLFGYSLTLVISVWMAWETARSALHSLSVGEFRYGVIQMPVWPARLVIPIGLALFAMALTKSLIGLIRRHRQGVQEEDRVQESTL